MIHRAEVRQFFTIVDGTPINDAELSLEALGLLVRMLSLNEEWEFSVEGLISRFGIGRKTLLRCIKELKARGYLEIYQVKNKGGKFSFREWHVFEVSRSPKNGITENGITKNGNTENGNTKNRITENRNTENGRLTNINITNINKTNIKETNNNIVPKNNKKAYGEFGNVMLTEEEFTKLEERLGPEDRDGLIEELSCYLCNHPKKYKDHYATLLSWARKRSQEKGRRRKPEALIDPFAELMKKEGFT